MLFKVKETPTGFACKICGKDSIGFHFGACDACTKLALETLMTAIEMTEEPITSVTLAIDQIVIDKVKSAAIEWAEKHYISPSELDKALAQNAFFSAAVVTIKALNEKHINQIELGRREQT